MKERTCDLNDAAPSVIDRIVGQKQAVELLKVALAAYWNERSAGLNPLFCNCLFVGPPGTGKTLLARVLASELGGHLRECLGQTLGMGEDLHAVLLDCTDETVLFIDEAHLLSEYAQTMLLKACDEHVIQIARGPFSRKYVSVPLSRFKLVLATTDEHCVLPALRDRMKLLLRFDYYTTPELAEVCRQRAAALQWRVDADVFILIAQRSKSTPRFALRLLESCHRTCWADGADVITAAHLHRTAQLEGLAGEFGLDKTEQAYLQTLAEGTGNPVRLNVIATRLGLPAKTISEVAERFLLRQGLITRTDSGRLLTEKGQDYLRTQMVASIDE